MVCPTQPDVFGAHTGAHYMNTWGALLITDLSLRHFKHGILFIDNSFPAVKVRRDTIFRYPLVENM